MVKRLSFGATLAVLVAVSASVASARMSYSDRFVGTEILPISSTLGTFLGVARGQLPGQWRVQITHQPLASGPIVAITGGTFTMRTLDRRRLAGTVTGGSVAVVNRGARCTNQTYTVDAISTVAHFLGTLTHHRRPVLGRCIIYAATISGTTTLNG